MFELQHQYPLKLLLKIARLKRSIYYYTLSKTHKDKKNDKIMNMIIHIFYTYKRRYSYRKIALELKNKGYVINHKKVKRLMSVMRFYIKIEKAKYKSYKGDRNGIVKKTIT